MRYLPRIKIQLSPHSFLLVLRALHYFTYTYGLNQKFYYPILDIFGGLQHKNDPYTYKKKIKKINYLFKKQNKFQKRHRFSKPVKYDKQHIFVLGWKWRGRVNSYFDSAYRSIEKKRNSSNYPHSCINFSPIFDDVPTSLLIFIS